MNLFNGHNVFEMNDFLRCPDCGKLNEAWRDFCKKCGEYLWKKAS